MSYFYSPAANGFFNDRIHSTMPVDVVSLTNAQYRNIISSLDGSVEIIPGDDGRPSLRKIPGITSEQSALLRDEQKRDAYRAESDPLFFKAQAGEIPLSAWVAKRNEIKARFAK